MRLEGGRKIMEKSKKVRKKNLFIGSPLHALEEFGEMIRTFVPGFQS